MQLITLQILPVRVTIRRTDLFGRAVFEFENRMNLPIVVSRKVLIEKVVRIEHQKAFTLTSNLPFFGVAGAFHVRSIKGSSFA